MLDIGDRMPEFALRTARREVVTQDDLLGSIAIVAFYALAFTGG